MQKPDYAALLEPAMASALSQRGFACLTPVQVAVLDPALRERDLRITSQTGSGKTLAIGFALRALVPVHSSTDQGIPLPRCIVVAPTRELAKQVEAELSWLFAPQGSLVVSVTGGADLSGEWRALARAPAVVVGTPGRLLDHLTRGALDARRVGALVLDEADRLLEMGFRDELDAILAFLPTERRTHLVSATFPCEVEKLASRVQRDAVHVVGTQLGHANADIDHVVHLIEPHQRVDAIVNLLLANPNEQTLIFARTRSDVGLIAKELGQSGFAVGALSGEMAQTGRDQALSSFRRGALKALVATDVAARGLDVQTIVRVIHAEPPLATDDYIHRSGRTGRAGRKGTSSILVSPPALKRTLRLLEEAGLRCRFEPIPSAEAIARRSDERLFGELTRECDRGATDLDARTWALAHRLTQTGDPTLVVAQLLAKTQYAGPTPARAVRRIDPAELRQSHRAAERAPALRRDANRWVLFRVSWGKQHGADVGRLLPMVCRRGGITGSDVGNIHVEPTYSVLEVRKGVAQAFAASSARHDPRNPRVRISLERQTHRRFASRRG
ncbi:DEAD/DEAH box helicase [Myxococcota bacterium]